VRLDIKETGKSLERAKERIEECLLNLFPGSYVVSKNAQRLPNTTLLIFPNIEGEMAVHSLLEQGIVASTGSACSAGADQPSHVLLAMKQPYDLARNALRLSLGLDSKLDPDELILRMRKAIQCC
jgi:cysteine desulfurase